VWIATALLHTEQPDREEFSVGEIVARAVQEGLHEPLRPGVMIHASYHCVANRKPNPGNYRMLTATASGQRRLYRTGDLEAAGRIGKITPRHSDIPKDYHYLLAWYRRDYDPASSAATVSAEPPTPNRTREPELSLPSRRSYFNNVYTADENLSNTEIVLRHVHRYPGLDDDEISKETGIQPRQQVNIILRALAAAGQVRRIKTPGYKIRNYPA
jgi:hypothetical protein